MFDTTHKSNYPQLEDNMTTIPSRLARLTSSSLSPSHAAFRSRSLYRQWYRSAPEITQLYALNVPASAIRAKIRNDFERNKNVTDLQTIDILLTKGYMEYQETVNCWKMESQIMRWFAKEEVGVLLNLADILMANLIPPSPTSSLSLASLPLPQLPGQSFPFPPIGRNVY